MPHHRGRALASDCRTVGMLTARKRSRQPLSHSFSMQTCVSVSADKVHTHVCAQRSMGAPRQPLPLPCSTLTHAEDFQASSHHLLRVPRDPSTSAPKHERTFMRCARHEGGHCTSPKTRGIPASLPFPGSPPLRLHPSSLLSATKQQARASNGAILSGEKPRLQRCPTRVAQPDLNNKIATCPK
jgi:hypothetical protein